MLFRIISSHAGPDEYLWDESCLWQCACQRIQMCSRPQASHSWATAQLPLAGSRRQIQAPGYHPERTSAGSGNAACHPRSHRYSRLLRSRRLASSFSSTIHRSHHISEPKPHHVKWGEHTHLTGLGWGSRELIYHVQRPQSASNYG